VRWYLVPTILLLFAAPLSAAPPKVPAVVTLRTGEITSVEIAADPGKEVAWAPGFAPEACYLDEGKPLRKDTCRLIVAPKTAGVFRVVLWTVGEREYATLVIDASGAPVPPGPSPPVPPPVPPVPPVDPILNTIQAAYGADTSATKAADKTALAAVYRAVAESLGDVKTAGDLFAVVKGATEQRIAGRLKPLRSVFGGELEKVLPADPAAVLTAQQKADAAKQLNRFSEVLGGVK
jgi:hypothetical protein